MKCVKWGTTDRSAGTFLPEFIPKPGWSGLVLNGFAPNPDGGFELLGIPLDPEETQELAIVPKKWQNTRIIKCLYGWFLHTNFMSDSFRLHMNIFHVPVNGLIVLLIAVSENPPACTLRKPPWDVVGTLTDHVAAVEAAEGHRLL